MGYFRIFNPDRTLYRPLMYAFDASPGVQKSGLMKIFEFSKLSDLGKIRGPDRQALSRSKNVLASRINSRMRVLEHWEIRRSRGAPPILFRV